MVLIAFPVESLNLDLLLPPAYANRFGNYIEYTASGMLHSSGMGLQVERDGQDRVKKIIDPAGYERKYFTSKWLQYLAALDQIHSFFGFLGN